MRPRVVLVNALRRASRVRVTRAGLRASTSRALMVAIVAGGAVTVARAIPASAAPSPVTRQAAPAPVPGPAPGTTEPGGDGDASISVHLPDDKGSPDKPNSSVLVILMLTVLAVAPSLLVMVTGFTRIIIVLSLTRNALGLQSIPPNQVLVGLALFLSAFVMFPTLSQVNDQALQPLMKGEISEQVAYERATGPLRSFMLEQTRKSELNMFVKASGRKPETPKHVGMSTLIPAFVLSELKTAFIIGFVIFVPFLIIDLIVSSALMSMGMFMLPPVLVSLPFKLLLFVMVDGWSLVARSLVTSFR